MKGKEKQIEEMAKVMCGNDCEECAKESAEFYQQTLEEARNNKCLLKNCAKTLYNAGYRKLPEDSVVLSKGAYESLSSKAKANVVNAVEIRKETAEKILQPLYDACKDDSYGQVVVDFAILERLAKQFGVEIKE